MFSDRKIGPHLGYSYIPVVPMLPKMMQKSLNLPLVLPALCMHCHSLVHREIVTVTRKRLKQCILQRQGSLSWTNTVNQRAQDHLFFFWPQLMCSKVATYTTFISSWNRTEENDWKRFQIFAGYEILIWQQNLALLPLHLKSVRGITSVSEELSIYSWR